TPSDGMTKRGKVGRPTKRKDGVPMTGAERQARYYGKYRKSINRDRRYDRKKEKRGNAAELRRAAWIAAHSKNPEGIILRIGDWREVIDAPPGSPHHIPDNSVALVLTDPPYEKSADDHWRKLPAFAARVLKPGGSLVCYTATDRLFTAHAEFSRYLTP